MKQFLLVAAVVCFSVGAILVLASSESVKFPFLLVGLALGFGAFLMDKQP